MAIIRKAGKELLQGVQTGIYIQHDDVRIICILQNLLYFVYRARMSKHDDILVSQIAGNFGVNIY